MANSFVRYTGNNSTTSYSIPFSYRATSDLTVTLSGVVTTSYTLNSAGTTLTFTTTPAQDVAIEIRRRTSQGTKLVDYASGSVLTENDLDTDSDQAFFMSQEAIDDAGDVIKISSTDFQYDATNKQIRNVANPTSAQDVATKDYLENTFLTSANKSALTTVNANIANINAVNSNASNINSAVSNATNINTVATNIGSVNTVATDIAKVIAVANDLAEAVSEIETVADDLNEATSEIDTVSNNIANVNIVGGISANVTTVAGISANVTTVAGNNANVTTVAGISGDVTTVAGISTDVSAVENISANVTTVAGIDSDVTTVAGIASAVVAVSSNSTNISAVNANSTNINTVSGNNTNINTVAGNNANISTVAGISGNVTTVAGISANVSAVAGDATDIGTVATNLTGTNTIGTVAGAITNVNNVGGSIANVNTVAGNLSGVNYFGERYRVSATAPTTSLDVGDLYYDTATDAMKVYGASGWQAAGSSVNGTSQRYNYTATNAQTTFTGTDNNGNTLTYDAGYIDVYLNGVKLLNGTDVTVSSGSSVVLASGATTGDVVDIVAYGTFSVASLNADNLDSGTVPDARFPATLPAISGANLTNLDASDLASGTVPSARISGAYTGITQTGTLASFASTGIDDNATSTAITIDSSNRVGIGTASPEVSLHIKSNSGIRAERFANSAGSANLDLNKSRNATIGSHTILQNGDGIGAIIFRGSDGTNYENAAAISAEVDGTPGTNDMPGRLTFSTTPDGANAYTERMRITSSGNLLVGTTDNLAGISGSLTQGAALSSGSYGGLVAVSRSGNTPIIANRQTSDGTIQEFRKDGTSVGTIGVNNSDNIFIGGTASNHSGIEFSASTVLPRNNNTLLSNTVDLGNSSVLWKDAYLSGGLYVGGTAAANKLDDYEEGDWTPTVGGNATYSVQRGRYYKIGNIVVALYQIQIGVLGTGSVGQISGLPFTSENDGALNIRSGYVSYFANLAVSVGSIASYVINNGTSFYFVSTTGDQVTCNNGPNVLGNNAHIYGTVIYNTA
jgi:hypothetical protein